MPMRLVLVVALLVLGGCAHIVPIEYADRTVSTAIPDPQTTALGRQSNKFVAKHPAKQSGFLLLDKGEEALLWRGMLADRATRTIDAQYFIWNQDNVGTIAAERLLRAAERGVRVRVIVDELTLDADPRFLALLNAHQLVEIRLYNPVGTLGLSAAGKVTTIMRTLGDFRPLNRRMHNKVFIVDGSVAILGGRNIADEYYDLNARHNFRDLDVLTMGPIVPDISGSFDEYWNNPWVVPIEAVLDLKVPPQERDTYYRQLHEYASQPKNFPPRFTDGLVDIGACFDSLEVSGMDWGRARLAYDRPGKNPDLDRLDAFGESGRQLTELALGTRRELTAETPYLVMLKGTYDLLARLRERGVRVALITNSMAATDAIWVQASYAFQRRRLLGMGVELFEYRADAEDRPYLTDRYELMEKAPVGIHAKTMVIDREVVFIGSFNMDPRSTHINTEIGLIIESPALAEKVAQLIERDMAPQNSWRLELTSEGGIEWATIRGGRPVRFAAEPDVGLGKIVKFLLLAILPITPFM